ncbi:DUF1648 domain-containing protein [Actinoplanes aureus]|uniref:DUF1648 domain-containing protein n=1 Tax=Actinoplanes aureus TaxID=2792083 RepID=A0A931G7L4_9ACTN|nr:DUF1648 domain-containing protein [Actinoplanes aureus]MBG0568379.1 DUF1648 domain-containing protein [Actinoplanes aureus]
MRRLLAAAALVWLPVAVIAATWAMWSGELPTRVATHWGTSGAPDRFSSTTGFWVTLLAIGIVAGLTALTAAVATLRAGAPAEADVARFLLIGAGAAAGAVAGMWVATATAALANPADPRLGWRFLWFVAGLAWGLVVRAAAGRFSRPVLPAAPGVDPLDLGPTERAAYSTTLRSPLITGVTLASAALVAVLAATVQPGLWLVAAIPLLAGLTFGRIRVTADRRGLRLVAGLVGVPLKHIPLTDIATAEAADINPLEWGGWGYRVLPGRAALVLRGGPALVLHLRDGHRFAVTLDHPRTPAALLTALQSRIPD